MSYCRFSSDDYQCDLYCYADVAGGYTTHIASNRVVYPDPLPDKVPFDSVDPEPWLERHRKIMEILETVKREPITFPHAGESFNDATLDAFLERLIELKKLGYRFPDSVIEAVKEELEEENHE